MQTCTPHRKKCTPKECEVIRGAVIGAPKGIISPSLELLACSYFFEVGKSALINSLCNLYDEPGKAQECSSITKDKGPQKYKSEALQVISNTFLTFFYQIL